MLVLLFGLLGVRSGRVTFDGIETTSAPIPWPSSRSAATAS